MPSSGLRRASGFRGSKMQGADFRIFGLVVLLASCMVPASR